MNELSELKQRYERRLIDLKPNRIDQEAIIVLKQIKDVEQLIWKIEKERALLIGFFDNDNFNSPGNQRAIYLTRAIIAELKEHVTALGFERYIPPNSIDHA